MALFASLFGTSPHYQYGETVIDPTTEAGSGIGKGVRTLKKGSCHLCSPQQVNDCLKAALGMP
jgi:hypothetical protein